MVVVCDSDVQAGGPFPSLPFHLLPLIFAFSSSMSSTSSLRLSCNMTGERCKGARNPGRRGISA